MSLVRCGRWHFEMNESLLVIVNGHPGAGKSTLARKLADELPIPLLMKDQLKEILYDTLGWSNRKWSKKLGGASYELLFHLIECQLRARQPAIVESPFYVEWHTARFLDIKAAYPFEPFQLFCRCDPEVMFARFNLRATSGERHPGHVDHLGMREQFLQTLATRKIDILDIGGTVVEIDTTPEGWLDSEDVQAAIRTIHARLKRNS